MTYSVVAQRVLLWALDFNQGERRDIENAMKQSRFIGEIMVIGDGEKCRALSYNLILTS